MPFVALILLAFVSAIITIGALIAWANNELGSKWIFIACAIICVLSATWAYFGVTNVPVGQSYILPVEMKTDTKGTYQFVTLPDRTTVVVNNKFDCVIPEGAKVKLWYYPDYYRGVSLSTSTKSGAQFEPIQPNQPAQPEK